MYVNPLYILAECQNNELYLAREDRILRYRPKIEKLIIEYIIEYVVHTYVKNNIDDLEQGLISLKLN